MEIHNENELRERLLPCYKEKINMNNFQPLFKKCLDNIV